MPVTKKPRPMSQGDVTALIEKGGSVPTIDDMDPHGVRTMFVQLRLTAAVVRRIDQLLEQREIRTPRHTWLLEAVHEKLRRDEAKPA